MTRVCVRAGVRVRACVYVLKENCVEIGRILALGGRRESFLGETWMPFINQVF